MRSTRGVNEMRDSTDSRASSCSYGPEEPNGCLGGGLGLLNQCDHEMGRDRSCWALTPK